MVLIETELTPNPNAYKFIIDQTIIARGKISYTTAEQCGENLLALSLLAIDHVVQVHFFHTVISVTQDGMEDWTIIEPKIREVIEKRIPEHDQDIEIDESSKPANLNEDLAKIEAILDRTIRQALQTDGGDLEVIELKGSTLTVQYQGACGGCPSATSGTLKAIESILQDEYDPELVVTAI